MWTDRQDDSNIKLFISANVFQMKILDHNAVHGSMRHGWHYFTDHKNITELRKSTYGLK